MFTNTSNLYAMRVYAENPLSLWHLDDNLSFISLLSQSQKNIENWTFTNASAGPITSASAVTAIPMIDEITSGFQKTTSGVTSASVVSLPMYVSNMDPDKKTITINAHIYKTSSLPKTYSIGFICDGVLYQNSDLVLSSFTNWQTMFHSIEIPSSCSVVNGFFSVEYFDNGIGADYDIFVNGLSVGQWSDEYVNLTTGIYPINLSSSAPFYAALPSSSSQYKYVSSDIYGINNEDNGYYIVEGNRMLANNSGMPMAYGSSNITKLYPPKQQGIPSIILPGKGFLNKRGQYNELTAEFWLKINNKSSTPFKIFGSLSSTDGLYVEEEFLTLRIDKYSFSHYISKWFRPMLIDIVYSPTNISLLVNGSIVISFPIIADDISFPLEQNDWMAFFTNSDCQPMEIDCCAIYPYVVSEGLAKRRFVYGQGVGQPDLIASDFNADNVFIDFAFAKYSSNITYPDQRPWQTGFSNNIDTTSRYLSIPQYTLPEIIIYGDDLSIFNLTNEPRLWDEVSSQSWSYWYATASWDELQTKTSADITRDIYFAQDESRPFFTMRPNPTSYANIHPTIYFNNLSILNTPLTSILGVFRSSASVSASAQTLMRINSKNSSRNFKVNLQSSSVSYVFNNGTSDTVLQSFTLQSSASAFIAGININDISRNYALYVNDFFNNVQNLDLSLGGYEKSTFTGKIYSLTFNSSDLTSADDFDYFDSNGFALTSASTISISDSHDLFDYVGTYTLTPFKTSKSIELDVGGQGYWESSIPLSYFASFATDSNGFSYYDLDSIQFNIDFPSSIVKTGGQMSNIQNYYDLKSYITLQNVNEVGTIPYSNWISASAIPTNRVIDFDNTLDVLKSKYEVIDGTIIFPPRELVDFNDYYLGLHIEMKTKSVYRKPIRLQKMSFASLAVDESNFYPIKTKTGMSLYPFTRYGDVYSLKEKNPFVIGRESMPYLYLSQDSGISTLLYSQVQTRGLSIPINQKLSPEYSLGGIQFWGMYNYSELINEEKTAFIISTPSSTYELKMIPESNGLRANMKVYQDGQELTSVTYNQNGNVVNYFTLEPMQWNSYTIVFGQEILLGNTLGQFEILDSMIVNNISFFQNSSDVFNEIAFENKWTQILFDESSASVSWNFWYSNDYTWDNVLNSQQASQYTIDASGVFESQLGISSLVFNDDSTLIVDYERTRLLNDAKFSLFSGTPV